MCASVPYTHAGVDAHFHLFGYALLVVILQEVQLGSSHLVNIFFNSWLSSSSYSYFHKKIFFNLFKKEKKWKEEYSIDLMASFSWSIFDVPYSLVEKPLLEMGVGMEDKTLKCSIGIRHQHGGWGWGVKS